MILKRVQVSNYKCLEDVVITFDPRINPLVFSLVGVNGSGKSTLLNLLYNIATGSSTFRGHGVVTLTVVFDNTEHVLQFELRGLEWKCVLPDQDVFGVFKRSVRLAVSGPRYPSDRKYFMDEISLGSMFGMLTEAREKDSRDVVTKKRYGSRFAEMMAELNVIPFRNPKAVNYVLDRRDYTLSKGEAKMVGVWAWIKMENIKNSIVLIDGIEDGLHPSWQGKVVNWLTGWESSNQYILATHSYDLCDSLTPAHIKELSLAL